MTTPPEPARQARSTRKAAHQARGPSDGDGEVAQLVACHEVIPCQRGRMFDAQTIEREKAQQEDIGFLQGSVGTWTPMRSVAKAEQLWADALATQLAVGTDGERMLSYNAFIGIG